MKMTRENKQKKNYWMCDNPVVIDNGQFIKAGFGGSDGPSCVVPAVVHKVLTEMIDTDQSSLEKNFTLVADVRLKISLMKCSH